MEKLIEKIHAVISYIEAHPELEAGVIGFNYTCWGVELDNCKVSLQVDDVAKYFDRKEITQGDFDDTTTINSVTVGDVGVFNIRFK